MRVVMWSEGMTVETEMPTMLGQLPVDGVLTSCSHLMLFSGVYPSDEFLETR